MWSEPLIRLAPIETLKRGLTPSRYVKRIRRSTVSVGTILALARFLRFALPSTMSPEGKAKVRHRKQAALALPCLTFFAESKV